MFIPMKEQMRKNDNLLKPRKMVPYDHLLMRKKLLYIKDAEYFNLKMMRERMGISQETLRRLLNADCPEVWIQTKRKVTEWVENWERRNGTIDTDL